jgi:hypothetical protein
VHLVAFHYKNTSRCTVLWMPKCFSWTVVFSMKPRSWRYSRLKVNKLFLVYDNYYMFRQLTLKTKTVFAFGTPLCWYVLQGSYPSPCAQLFTVLCQRIAVSGDIQDSKYIQLKLRLEVTFVWFDWDLNLAMQQKNCCCCCCCCCNIMAKPNIVEKIRRFGVSFGAILRPDETDAA